MNSGAYRDLQLLDLIGEGRLLTQRALAGGLNVALGVTNLCLQRLARKGYINIVNVQPKRLRYLVTPKEISEKWRLTYEYVAQSVAFYRVARRHLAEVLTPLREAGHRRVAIYGAGEVAELAYLSLQELQMEFVGVFATEGVGKAFLGGKVLGRDQLAHADFDRIVVARRKSPGQVRRPLSPAPASEARPTEQ